MTLTAAHGIYAGVTLAIIGAMLFRRGVVLPALLGTLLVAWVHEKSFAGGLQAIFKANMVAAKELFGIFLIITFMVALLRSLNDLGADRRMVVPIGKMMVNGHVAFLILAGATYILSLFSGPLPRFPWCAPCWCLRRFAPGFRRWGRLWPSPSPDKGWPCPPIM